MHAIPERPRRTSARVEQGSDTVRRQAISPDLPPQGFVAVPGLVASPAAAGTTIRRASLNIRPKATKLHDAGTISGVSKLPKRPPSNLRQGQGQHHTAYVVYEDTMRHAVMNKTPQQAALSLIDVINDFRQLPKLAKRSQFNDYILKGLADSENKLRVAATSTPDAAADIVGEQIDWLLYYRNGVPGSAASKFDTHGHGEANSSGVLRVYEESAEDLVGPVEGRFNADQALEMMWHLLDYNPPPGTGIDQVAEKVETHFRSLQSAYPSTFRWLSSLSVQYHLFTWLANNKSHVGALSNVAKSDLPALQGAVYDRLGW